MDAGAWWAAVHGVAKSRTRLSDFTFTFHFHALEKEMTTHSSVLFFFFVVNFVIHWNETAMGLHVFPIPIPPPTSLSTRSP